MKLLLIAALTLYICGCTFNSATPIPTAKAEDPVPTAEIDKAVRDFLIPHYATKVRGVTLHKQAEGIYLAGADIDNPRGDNEVYQLLVRQFDDQGRKYWKAEEFSMRIVDAISGKDGENAP